MKTAIWVPDDVFERVERLVRNSGRSRSELCSAALREYVARHGPEDITDSLDRALERIGREDDDSSRVASRQALETTVW